MFVELKELTPREKGLLTGASLLGLAVYFALSWFGIISLTGAWELLILGGYILVLNGVLQVPFYRWGFGLAVEPDWGHWFRFTLKVGLAIGGLCLLAGFAALSWHKSIIPDYGHHFGLAEFQVWLLYACIRAPLVEEALFRWMLCPVLVASLGQWPAVFLSGSLFALAHFVYGNPGPDNFVAGYFLAWAFIKSRNYWVPVAMHAAGNFCVALLYLVISLLGW